MIEELKKITEEKFKRQLILAVKEEDTPISVLITPKDLPAFLRMLHEHPEYYFDLLSCITGIDNGPEAGTMEVIYSLCSIPFERSLMIKTVLDRENPVIPSVSDLFKTALWHEREVYDMFGIRFENHPDLRRILLPADWEGYPLRKDYTHQEYYHGIRVEY
jgi:NADH-quinone oxidoreductase subunit C